MKKKLVPKHHSQLSCCHYITIYDPQLQNTIVLRTHPQQRETLMQPFHWDLQRLELPNTIEVQRTTVEHIALMHQFQCTKCLNTCKKHNSTAATKKRKSHLEPSVPLRAQIEQGSTAKGGSPKPSRTRANFSPQRNPFTPKDTMFRANPNIQIAFMMYSSSNAICQEWLAKDNRNRKTLENKYPSRGVNAAISMRSAETELQNTIDWQGTAVEHIAVMHQFQCTKCLNTCKTQ